MNTAGVPESLSYISLTFSFIAITLTIILNNWNYISNIFIKVSSRNRDNALHERLDDIEFALRRIERVSNFKESKKIVDNNPKYKKLSPVLISIIGIGIFLFVTSLIALTLFPNNSSDIAIAVTTGVISGFFILMFQKSILERV
jgi:uncharacterized membrane protein YbhN (UPF0104 family)